MIIFLHGPDEYRRESRKNFYTALFRKKYPSASVGVFDLVEAEERVRLREFIRGQSMFAKEELAIVQNISSALGDTLLLQDLKITAGIKHNTILFSEAKKPEKALQFLLKPPAHIEEFEYLQGKEWTHFIHETAQREGVMLEEDACLFLARVYTNDTWRLVSELKKLAFVAKKPLAQKNLIGLGLEYAPDFWTTFQLLKTHNASSRLFGLETLFSHNESAAKIFNMLAYQTPETQVLFAAYDVAVKSGAMDYEEALTDFALLS